MLILQYDPSTRSTYHSLPLLPPLQKFTKYRIALNPNYPIPISLHWLPLILQPAALQLSIYDFQTPQYGRIIAVTPNTDMHRNTVHIV